MNKQFLLMLLWLWIAFSFSLYTNIFCIGYVMFKREIFQKREQNGLRGGGKKHGDSWGKGKKKCTQHKVQLFCSSSFHTSHLMSQSGGCFFYTYICIRIDIPMSTGTRNRDCAMFICSRISMSSKSRCRAEYMEA